MSEHVDASKIPSIDKAPGLGKKANSGRSKRGRPRKSNKEEHHFPVQPRVVNVIKKPRTVVNHSYRDFSNVPPDLASEPTQRDEMTFSEKLHEVLSTEEYTPYISWMTHGRAFRVHIPKRFESKVSPKYFGHSRYSSFLRQLNNYGFKHITKGPDRNCYYHESFLRGLPHLCKYMPKPKNARRLIPDPENEPNFYQISESFPIPEVSSQPPAVAMRTMPQELHSKPPTINPLSEGLIHSISSSPASSAGSHRLDGNHVSRILSLHQNLLLPHHQGTDHQHSVDQGANLAMTCELSGSHRLAQVTPSSLTALASLQALQQHRPTHTNAIMAAAANAAPVRRLGISSTLNGMSPSALTALSMTGTNAQGHGALRSRYPLSGNGGSETGTETAGLY